MLARMRGLKVVQAKGRVYCYHRATGKRLQAAPTLFRGLWVATPELLAEVAALEASPTTPKPGSVYELIASYRASPAFADLSERSKKDYRRVLLWMGDRAGKESPRALTSVRAREIRDHACHDE